MKIVLISPYPDIQSYGIRVLSSCLKKQGHDVRLLFLPKCFADGYEKNTLDQLNDISKGAGLIGISVMTNFFDNAVQLTNSVKRLGIPVIWGGIHPTIRPQECLEYADLVSVGESEATLVELARNISGGLSYYGIQGLCFKQDGKVVANSIRPLSRDLDALPAADYEHRTHYILDGRGILEMRDDLLLKYTYGAYLTMPTRGCPFGCTYCCNNRLNRIYGEGSVRKRSIDNILDELREVRSKLPMMNRVVFDDDAFFSYTAIELKEFSRRYKQDIGLPLTVNGISPATFNEEKLSYLIAAGLTALRLGIQTAAPRVRELYGRKYSNRDIEKAVLAINGYKDKVRLPFYDIILDNPWEKEEELIETLLFLSRLPAPYELVLYSLTFYPETALYLKAKGQGLIKDDRSEVYSKYYHDCKKTYLNRLFFLLRRYTRGGGRVPLWLMHLLTSRKIRRLKINRLVYYMASAGAIPFILRWYAGLLAEALKDIGRGDWSRVIWYKKRMKWQKQLAKRKS